PFKKLPFNGRCTQKGNTLYLHVFQWPQWGGVGNPPLTLTGLQNKIQSVRVLGGETVRFSQSAGADKLMTTRIQIPAKLDPIATVFELKLAGPPVIAEITSFVRSQSDGSLVLTAADATVEGRTAKVETKEGKENIGYWTNAKDIVTWLINPSEDATYH